MCVCFNCVTFSRSKSASKPGIVKHWRYSHHRTPVLFPGPAAPPHKMFRAVHSHITTCLGTGTNRHRFSFPFNVTTIAWATCRCQHASCGQSQHVNPATSDCTSERVHQQ